ncbi:MAG: AraC family transcriptional regulator [Planctomycetota bacterium]
MSQARKQHSRIRCRQYIPAGHLRPCVDCYWTMTSETALQAAVPHRVVPDGCVDIIFDLNGASSPQAASIVGTMTRPIIAQLEGKLDFIAVRFLPGGAFPFLDSPMNAFTDRIVPLEMLWARKGQDLTQRLASQSHTGDRIQLLDQYLTHLLGTNRRGDPAVQATVHSILRSGGNIKISELATVAGCSQRQLRRKFTGWIGVAPKVLCRIIRFQHVLQMLRANSNHSLLFAALDSGYYDQSHFIHEFNSCYGRNPSEFMQIRNL